MKDEIFVDFEKMIPQVKMFSLLGSILFLLTFLTWVFTRNFLLFMPLSLLVLIGMFFGRLYYRKIFLFYQAKPYLILNEKCLIIQNISDTFQIEWQNITDIGMNDHGYFVKADREYQLSKKLLANNVSQTIDILKQYAEKYGTAKFIY